MSVEIDKLTKDIKGDSMLVYSDDYVIRSTISTGWIKRTTIIERTDIRYTLKDMKMFYSSIESTSDRHKPSTTDQSTQFDAKDTEETEPRPEPSKIINNYCYIQSLNYFLRCVNQCPC